MNIYAILGIIAALVGYSYWLFSMGQDSVTQKADRAALEYREKEIELLRKIEDANKERDAAYRDRIHVVQGASDPSGCLDSPFPQSFIDGLRGPSSSEAKPKPHG